MDIGAKKEFASVDTPQRKRSTKSSGKTLTNIVRRLLQYSGLPYFLWGSWWTVAYPGDRASDEAFVTVTPYIVRTGKSGNLGHLRAIGTRAKVHVETYERKPEPRAWEGRLVMYSLDSGMFHANHPEERNMRESRARCVPRDACSRVKSTLARHFDLGAFTYDEPDDHLRDVREYTSRINLSSTPWLRTTKDVSVPDLLDQIRDITDPVQGVTAKPLVYSETSSWWNGFPYIQRRCRCY